MSADLVRRAADALDQTAVTPAERSIMAYVAGSELAPTLAAPLAAWLRIAAKEIADVSEIAAPNGEPIEFEGPAIDVARAILEEAS